MEIYRSGNKGMKNSTACQTEGQTEFKVSSLDSNLAISIRIINFVGKLLPLEKTARQKFQFQRRYSLIEDIVLARFSEISSGSGIIIDVCSDPNHQNEANS